MGHPQPPTPIQTDNSTTLDIVNNTIQPKRMKAMDMRFHWLRCRINQKHFRPYWRAGATNLADYVTKHYPVIHHQAVRPLFLTTDHLTLPNSKLTAPCIPRNTLLRSPISRPAASTASLQTKNTCNLPVHSQNIRVYGEVTGISRVYGWVTGFFIHYLSRIFVYHAKL
eukprot:CCRYP_009392-RE/>CCRYP_009392-RE protein AED:0.61 eAED:0.43 QI:0/-1/0/1/-1/0/1/0/167